MDSSSLELEPAKTRNLGKLDSSSLEPEPAKTRNLGKLDSSSLELEPAKTRNLGKLDSSSLEPEPAKTRNLGKLDSSSLEPEPAKTRNLGKLQRSTNSLLASVLFVAALGSLVRYPIYPEMPQVYKKYILGVSSTFVVATVILLWVYLRRIFGFWDRLGVPNAKPSLIVGNTLRRFGITQPLLEFYDEMYTKYNGRDFCGFYDFFTPGIIVGNLQLLKHILVKDFDHFANRRILPLSKVNPIANEMLTNATGEDWRRIRTAITPTFTASKLRQLYPLICAQAEAFADQFHEEKEIKIQDLTGTFSMDTIASCAFGIERESANPHSAIFTKMASKVFQFSTSRAIKVIILLTCPYLAQLIQRLGVEFTSEEFSFFRKVVGRTLEMRRENGIWRGDFLDLMNDTKKLSETTMTSQAILFLLAGYDNIAQTLSFALHLLAINPQQQTRLREELNSVRNPNRDDISYDMLLKLPFLDAVVHETLRLYPPTPVAERSCTKDYRMPGANITLRKGQPVIVPIWSIQRDPQLWPDPNSFKPERFLNLEPKSNESIVGFLPFGEGPRQCIGLKFSKLVIKVGLMKLLLNHVTQPSANTMDPPPLHPRGVLSLKATNSLPIIITPINERVCKQGTAL